MLSQEIRRVHSKPIGHKSRAVKKSPMFLLAEETTQTKDDSNLHHTAAAKQARKIIAAKNKKKSQENVRGAQQVAGRTKKDFSALSDRDARMRYPELK
ncbi:hypothetical protein CDAR_87771 [Caerostris darwini]|uniref:Uncharacterized protein n=1 Tax=Caerostris darwini TaxID=1538125 RepID=A0AAV4S5I9_9ARAC|nr:hypothetical protein CDAR_87771 [Caerostris darwini]